MLKLLKTSRSIMIFAMMFAFMYINAQESITNINKVGEEFMWKCFRVS